MIESRPDWVISRQRAWGVPITVFVREKGDGSADILQDEQVNARIADGIREGRRRRLVCARRPRAFPRLARQRGLAEGRRYSRRLVRFRLDARFRARRPESFSGARPYQAQGRRRARDGDVSRRLRPASRLVSVVAVGKLRHPRPRAVRRRAHPRLRARRERLQNVEVARQRHRAAGRDKTFRRRHSAHVGVRRRLCRRSAHRPGNPQNHRRDLSQAAQHAALDAGQSGAFRGRG